MGLLPKAKAAPAAPVTREEIEELRAQLESLRAVAALVFAAVDVAAKAGPGTPDASPRGRLEKLAAAAGLEPGESAELRSFLKRLDSAGRVESARGFRDNQERARPLCSDDFMPGGRFSPRV